MQRTVSCDSYLCIHGYDPLMLAVNCCYIDNVRFLINNGADVNNKDGYRSNSL